MIRCDFVSNSSSSSFIFGCFTENKIMSELKKKDFIDAIKDLGGKQLPRRYWFILDKNLSKDNKIIHTTNKVDYLKEWKNIFVVKYKEDDYGFYLATNGITDDNKEILDCCDGVGVPGRHIHDWEHFYEMLKNIYDLDYDWIPGGTTYTYYNKKTENFTRRKIKKSVLTILHDAYQYYGIISNYDVLMEDFSRILIHFGDNDVYSLKGMNEASKNEDITEYNNTSEYIQEIKNSPWETPSHTLYRFCEVLYKWFVDNNRIDGTKYSWRDLCNTITGCCMHEG